MARVLRPILQYMFGVSLRAILGFAGGNEGLLTPSGKRGALCRIGGLGGVFSFCLHKRKYRDGSAHFRSIGEFRGARMRDAIRSSREERPFARSRVDTRVRGLHRQAIAVSDRRAQLGFL